MANKFINTVRNRLYKKGYQGFTKQEFIDCAIGRKYSEAVTRGKIG